MIRVVGSSRREFLDSWHQRMTSLWESWGNAFPLLTRIKVSYLKQVARQHSCHKKNGGRFDGAAPLGWGVAYWLISINTPFHHMCYTAEFGRSKPSGMSLIKEIRRRKN